MGPGGEETLAGVEAVLLVGGLGTRLRSSVADRPKVLAEVGGRPFLAYLLDQVAAAGARRALLCSGYLGEQIEAAFGARHGELALDYSQEERPLGTGGALRLACERLHGDAALVLNGDSYVDADLGALWSAHRAGAVDGTILLKEVPDAGRYGRVERDADGAVTAFREKLSGGPGWINAGIYVLARRLLGSIPAGEVVSLEQDILPLWVSKGLRGHETRGAFIDIGTPESYAAAERFFADLNRETRRP